MTKKERFLTYCKNRYKGNGTLIVKVKIKGQELPEFILNEDVNTKLAYYERAYNDDLELNTYNGIKIVGYAICESEIKQLDNITLQ